MLRNLRMHVARHRDVDDEQRLVRAPRHRFVDDLRGQNEVRRAGRGHHHVGGGEHVRKPREIDRVAETDFADYLMRIPRRAVRHDQILCAFGVEALCGGPSHLSGADDGGVAIEQRSEMRFGQIDSGGRNRGRLFADARLRARGFSGAHRFAEEAVQRFAERLCGLARGERILDLTQNLRLADEHRIQARADAQKMLDGLAAEQRVEVRLQIVRHHAVPEVL